MVELRLSNNSTGIDVLKSEVQGKWSPIFVGTMLISSRKTSQFGYKKSQPWQIPTWKNPTSSWYCLSGEEFPIPVLAQVSVFSGTLVFLYFLTFSYVSWTTHVSISLFKEHMKGPTFFWVNRSLFGEDRGTHFRHHLVDPFTMRVDRCDKLMTWTSGFNWPVRR